jgi:hypothetical protein
MLRWAGLLRLGKQTGLYLEFLGLASLPSAAGRIAEKQEWTESSHGLTRAMPLVGAWVH